MEYENRGRKFTPYLAGRAFLDPDFRERFLEDPERVAAQLGLNLTSSQIEHLNALDPAAVNEWLDGFEGYVGAPIMAMSAW